MPEQPYWGKVNLGVDVLQGHGEQSQPGVRDYDILHPRYVNKQQYNPGRNQELALPPDIFRMEKDTDWNPFSANGKIPTKNVHERIKELLGEGQPRRYAVQKAHAEAEQAKTDGGKISKKDIYRYKYQARTPSKQVSPLTEQVQNYPFV